MGVGLLLSPVSFTFFLCKQNPISDVLCTRCIQAEGEHSQVEHLKTRLMTKTASLDCFLLLSYISFK